MNRCRHWVLGCLAASGLADGVHAQEPPVPTPPAASTPQQPLIVPPSVPAPPIDPGLLAAPSARGTQAETTAFPQIFGDLPGSGAIAGPLPVFTVAPGQQSGVPVVVDLSNGQRVLLVGPTNQSGMPTSPGVFSTVPVDPNADPDGLFPPPGAVFDATLADLVAYFPTFVRGAFKITENDSPRPTSRVYVIYNFYDNVAQSVRNEFTSRVVLHQEIFGLEYAFADNRFSVGVRVPYNQIVGDELFNSTSFGDMTVSGKGIVWEDRKTGDLLSAGLALTIPTGQLPFASTLTGGNPRGSLIQPLLGHVLAWDRFFVQGLESIVVPTSGGQATFISNDLAAGYFVYRNPGGFLSGVVPVAEWHLNVPLTYRGIDKDNTTGFVDQLTVLGGMHFLFKNAGSVGFAAGAPITGPRPFSLQVSVQVNVLY